jgi:hypothetical protein
MSDLTTPDDNTNGMQAIVSNYGNLSGKSEGIPEEHQQYANEVLKMDPLRDVAGNINAGEGVRPLQLKAQSLPDDMRSEVFRQLERLPNMPKAERDKHESKLVQEAVIAKRASIRGLTGVHSNSLPFHKEQADIAMQVRELYKQRDGYQEALDKVVDVKKGQDPDTGELTAEPIYWLGSTKRAAFEDNIVDVDRKIRLLVAPDGSYGLEGRKRMQEALKDSAALLHQRAAAQANEKVAQQRADEIIRDEAIERRAEALARKKRGNAG